MQVWIPIFFAPARSLPAKAGCMSTSPPESVMPPLEARNTPRYRLIRRRSSEASTGSPSLMRKVSGLWQ